jgi:NADH-quinone oxidoreductase subunit L
MGLLFDPLSALMCLVVTGVGSLIHIYSIGYMDDDHREDKGFQRFFCYLNLFLFSMLVLVLGDNLVLMFLGWEGVGLCSYLLIGFWYSDRWNAYCGMKAFVVNRIGDFGFLVGIFLVFWSLPGTGAGHGDVSFVSLKAGIDHLAAQTVMLPFWLEWLPGAPEWRLTTLIALCFFVGAVGKSAQIPLYVWLPDAMAGPTPVSALIHAATMVTAGIYMVDRLGFLFAVAPGASAVVAWTGALTAILAASIAVAQTDIKKVLAYSTVSQLGYMFLAAGVGAYSAAAFHLATHAFFKALLFLGAGAVILALHHEQDTDKMGGLRRQIPWVHLVFLAGVIGIAGFPYISAGFFSKDEILLSAWLAHDIPGHGWLYGIGLLTAGLTSFYMFRLHFRTFFGESRVARELRDQIHQPARTVMVPLYVLAFLSIFGGYIGPSEAFIPIENANSLAHFLEPATPSVHHAVSHGMERWLALVATAAALAGLGLAWLLYLGRPELPGRIAASLGWLRDAVENKYWVDEIYDAVIVRPLVSFSDFFLYRSIDAGVIDGTGVNGIGEAIRGVTNDILKRLQTGFAQSYLLLMLLGSIWVIRTLVR